MEYNARFEWKNYPVCFGGLPRPLILRAWHGLGALGIWGHLIRWSPLRPWQEDRWSPLPKEGGEDRHEGKCSTVLGNAKRVSQVEFPKCLKHLLKGLHSSVSASVPLLCQALPREWERVAFLKDFWDTSRVHGTNKGKTAKFIPPPCGRFRILFKRIEGSNKSCRK